MWLGGRTKLHTGGGDEEAADRVDLLLLYPWEELAGSATAVTSTNLAYECL